ncbi:DUF4334 domain-containing protein [Mycobacterium sp. MYCO198283]|uniref:DUF4334 domain-containing protein n=1 Tax=Mycobacterium sp. MYCO198283 TaxID=2883505 RepID=UPI001E3D5D12|nr:DUF4334 domain-containing protein [Mycobacterium sp. MYCO198283]MCG5430917.1 DUF4334 domain-containing protein [Mycobacterium sp. MYCO198283]
MSLTDVFPTVPRTADEALAVFDAAPAVSADEMIGTWHGAELPTGHPLDGILAASGWWGKQFVDAETVHPLLFPSRGGTSLWAVDPIRVFGGMGVATRVPQLKRLRLRGAINAVRPVLRTRAPKGRLRTTRYRGVDTATMIYDQLPINDVFRRIDGDRVLGAMDLRGSTRPYFFVLERDDSLTAAGS